VLRLCCPRRTRRLCRAAARTGSRPSGVAAPPELVHVSSLSPVPCSLLSPPLVPQPLTPSPCSRIALIVGVTSRRCYAIFPTGRQKVCSGDFASPPAIGGRWNVACRATSPASCHSRGSGNPVRLWIPAFAGMTVGWVACGLPVGRRRTEWHLRPSRRRVVPAPMQSGQAPAGIQFMSRPPPCLRRQASREWQRTGNGFNSLVLGQFPTCRLLAQVAATCGG
jgi:hypothetical protein